MRIHSRRGFTLFELLVLLAVLVLAFALSLPALAKLHKEAEQAKATNNLKQLALGSINYADTNGGVLPPGRDDKNFSTAAYLLPFIEQGALYKLTRFDKSIDDDANAEARKAQVATFLSPMDPVKSVADGYGATNYLFNDQIFSLNSKARYPASFPDGTSNTILIGETLKGDGKTDAGDVQRRHVLLKKGALKGIKEDAGVKDFKDGKNIAGDRCARWIDGRFLQGTFNDRLQPNDARPDVDCEGEGGLSALRSLTDLVNVGLADGSVKLVNKKISQATWRNAMCPNDGNVLGSDW
jgi:type II secretory pathway pseudopilin PulG